MTKNSTNHIETAKSFESVLSLQKDLLANRAWRICYILAGLCVTLAIIILCMVILQKKELVLIRVDNRTGQAEVLSTVTKEEISEETAVGKYFAANYLLLREQYIYGAIQEDYRLVQIYSSSAVAEEYKAIFARDDAPDRVFAEDFEVKPEIISIEISDATESYKIASIRFKKKTTDLRNQKTKEEFFVARLVYDFHPEQQVKDKIRLVNPLGFKVASYQVTKEL